MMLLDYLYDCLLELGTVKRDGKEKQVVDIVLPNHRRTVTQNEDGTPRLPQLRHGMFFCLATAQMQREGTVFNNATPACPPPLKVPLTATSLEWMAAQAGSTNPARIKLTRSDVAALIEAALRS